MTQQTSHSSSGSPERSRTIESRCLMYALAAGGTALLTVPAKAEVVYTPANVAVQNGTIFVDINNDGISDFKLYDFCADCTSSGSIKYLEVRGAKNSSARVLGHKRGHVSAGSAFAAPYGFSIGPNSPKSFIGPLGSASGPAMAKGRCFAGSPCDVYGPWNKVTDEYLGFQFSISGQTHYGWARLTVKSSTVNRSIRIKAILTGYAYETQANTAILAGNEGAKTTAADAGGGPSPSLALLSLGSAGLEIWRRY